MRKLKACDLFCGGGGTTQGAEQSGAATVVCAVNHWNIAVETHAANFPHARHINSRLDQVNPSECPKIDLLFASPECTHHSRARGGRPTSDQQRSGAWDLMKWIEHHRPSRIVVENVAEFRQWGPVGENGRPLQKYLGKFFDAWVGAVQSAGYRVDCRLLNSADFGAATSRTRLFIVARKGNRNPTWPEPTHAYRVGGELPGLALKKWRAAAEIIDWSIPCKSVFLRKHPLKDNTLARIEAGLRRFVQPFVVELRHHNRCRDPFTEPVGTLTTGGHHGVAVPFTLASQSMGAPRGTELPTPTQTASGGVHLTVPFLTPNFGERNGQGPRTHDAGEPLPAVTSHGAGYVAVPFLSSFHCGADGANRNYPLDKSLPTLDTSNRYGVAVPFLQQLTHGGRELPIGQPMRTITTANRGETAIVVPFLTTYYGNGDAHSHREPLPTVTTRDRFGLAYAIVETAGTIEPRTEGERKLLATMLELGVADVGFRMLSNPELSAAMGFPSAYIFAGNKGQVTKQIGNAVECHMAEALTLEAAA